MKRKLRLVALIALGLCTAQLAVAQAPDAGTGGGIECDGCSSTGKGVNNRHLALARQIGKTQHEAIRQSLAAYLSGRYGCRVDVDVQSAGEQPVDTGCIKHRACWNGETRCVHGVLVEPNQDTTIGAGKIVMDMCVGRCKSVNDDFALSFAAMARNTLPPGS